MIMMIMIMIMMIIISVLLASSTRIILSLAQIRLVVMCRVDGVLAS